MERLLGGRCYHMMEVFGRMDDIPVWEAAAAGRCPDWTDFLADFVSAVDWPAAAFWRELSEANPEAVVLLSTRDVDAWWTSASNTIFAPMLADRSGRSPFPPGWPHELIAKRFTPGWADEHEAKRAYLRHNDEVRNVIGPDRLLEWSPGDGWEPICAALGMTVPAEPFPHVNTTEAFQARIAEFQAQAP